MPKHTHEVISNQIFESYRLQELAKKQKEAIKILATRGYVILDLENNIINKHNIHQYNI